MPQLHETQLGQNLLRSVLPRLAKELSRIADQLEIQAVVGDLPSNGRIVCKDGFSFMIGSSDEEPPLRFVSFCTAEEPILAPYKVEPKIDEVLVYSGVPGSIVAKTIIKHGGYGGN